MALFDEEKAACRKQVRRLYPGEEIRDAESLLLCGHLLAWDEFLHAETVCAYVPLKREADVRPIIEAVLQRGRRLILPRVECPGQMTLRVVRTMEELVPGAFGIPEPPVWAEQLPPETLDLMIVPLEALSPNGVRLGKGGGFYDRILPRIKCPAVGAVMSWQWQTDIPHDESDVRLRLAVDKVGLHCLDVNKNNG